MANDAIFLGCSKCFSVKMIYKHYPGDNGYSPKWVTPELMTEFFHEHLECTGDLFRNDFYCRGIDNRPLGIKLWTEGTMPRKAMRKWTAPLRAGLNDPKPR